MKNKYISFTKRNGTYDDTKHNKRAQKKGFAKKERAKNVLAKVNCWLFNPWFNAQNVNFICLGNFLSKFLQNSINRWIKHLLIVDCARCH